MDKKAKTILLPLIAIAIVAMFIGMVLIEIRPSPVSARATSPSLGGPSYARVGDEFTIPYNINWSRDGTSCMLMIGASYTSSLVSVTSINGGNYPCGSSQVVDNNPGTVNFLHSDSENRNPSSGTYSALRVTFRARAAGTFTYTVNSGSYNDYFLPSTSRSFTIYPTNCPSGQVGTPPNCSPASSPTPPPPTPTPTPSPSPAPAPTPAPSPSPAPRPTPRPSTPGRTPTPTTPQPQPGPSEPAAPQAEPKIEAVAFTSGITAVEGEVTASGAIAKATLTYRTTQDNEGKTIEIYALDDNRADLILSNLTPSTEYKYTLTATVGNKILSQEGSFRTQGYPVEIIVKQSERTVAMAKFTVDRKEYTTDNNGSALLSLNAGKYTIEIGTGIDKHTQTFTVEKVPISPDGMSAKRQTMTINIAPETAESATKQPFNWMPIIVGGVILLVIAGAAFLVIRRMRRTPPEPELLYIPPPSVFPATQPDQLPTANPSFAQATPLISSPSSPIQSLSTQPQPESITPPPPPVPPGMPIGEEAFYPPAIDTQTTNTQQAQPGTTSPPPTEQGEVFAPTPSNPSYPQAPTPITTQSPALNIAPEDAMPEDMYEAARKSHRFDEL